MLQSILDNTFPILAGFAIVFAGVDYYWRFWKKNDHLIEPEDVMNAYCRIVRTRRENSRTVGQPQPKA